MNKKILLFFIILAILAGGFFYFWYGWLPAQIEKERQKEMRLFTDSEPPTLFGKDDYQIEEREDGKYIVVEKVGLSCKVPDGWRVEKLGNDHPDGTSQYWIDLYSFDAEGESYLKKGCAISIITGNEEENNREIKEKISFIKNGLKKYDGIDEDYQYSVIKINDYEVLKWLSSERPIVGQLAGLRVPIGSEKIISFSTTFPPNYKEKCSPIWEEFLKTIEIR